MTYDAVVVGGGLAGVLTALELRPLRVALVSALSLGELTSTAWAQGGIAAALGDDDSPSQHAADTVAAGAGIVEARVAARLTDDAPRAIERIVSLGVRFDREDAARYSLGREAAHSRRRILRAGGDATGAELIRAVVAAAREAESIVPYEGARALEIVLDEHGATAGAIVRYLDGSTATLHAPAVVIATGGLGGLYRFTTNPPASRGAGIAMAARAGAKLADLEFVQFHPTALDVPADPLPLVTEALRGEGARLVDASGSPIMDGVDPALDLAPRDIVARRVFALRLAGERVFLDARFLGDAFASRFPTVLAACLRYGIDPRLVPIPVVAAAHYHMGGIAVDLDGATSVPGLYACGEVAATGVHGANRLASNSLLESVVYPGRIAAHLKASRRALPIESTGAPPPPYVAPAPEEWRLLRDEMYAHVGVERDGAGLSRAIECFAALSESTASEEVRDAATVALLVAQSALGRRETRGSHFRLDYPGSDADAPHRSFVTLGDGVGRSA